MVLPRSFSLTWGLALAFLHMISCLYSTVQLPGAGLALVEISYSHRRVIRGTKFGGLGDLEKLEMAKPPCRCAGLRCSSFIQNIPQTSPSKHTKLHIEHIEQKIYKMTNYLLWLLLLFLCKKIIAMGKDYYCC